MQNREAKDTATRLVGYCKEMLRRMGRECSLPTGTPADATLRMTKNLRDIVNIAELAKKEWEKLDELAGIEFI